MRVRLPVEGSVRTMMSANSSSVVSRPRVLTASWNSVPFGDGGAPTATGFPSGFREVG